MEHRLYLPTFARDFFANNVEIMKRKNADYSGFNSDPYANFKEVQKLGVDPVDGFLTRMMDKVCRIKTFQIRGSLKVTDESAKDTLADLANYSMLLAGFLQKIDSVHNLINHAEYFFKKTQEKLHDGTWNPAHTLEIALTDLSRKKDWNSCIDMAFYSVMVAYEFALNQNAE